MENIKRTTEEMLKEKMKTLKINLEKVGRDVLKAKYATAYQKLLNEINALSNKLIHEQVLCLDLSSIKEEIRQEFANIVNRNYPSIKKCLLDADFDGYMRQVNDLTFTYASFWCDNVMKPHIPGEPFIFNPFTLEKIEDVSVLQVA